MNITVTAEQPKDEQLAAQITIPAADVDKAIAKTYKEIAEKYRFQGFRRGKAPRPVIDSLMGKDAVLAQATNDLLNEAEPLMLEELNLVPVGQPNFGDDPALVEQGKDYVIDVTVKVRPMAELESYDAPSIEMPPAEATEAEADAQIEQLLSYSATYADLDEDRACEAGDVVSLTIENVEGAKHLEGENRLTALNGNVLPAELEEAVIGMKAGETKDVKWTKSHEHDGETLSHDFEVKVTLNGLKHLVTPELDDETAKKSFGFDTVEELRNAVKEEIAENKKSALPNLKEDRVVEAMGKQLKLDEIPEDYQNEIFNELASEFLGQLGRQNISLDMYLKARGVKTDDFIADLHVQAEERARQSLALDAVAQKLGLEATEEDVLAEFVKAGVENPEAEVESWRKQGRLPAVRDSIKRSKALDWLVENAQVTEVDEAAKKAAEASVEE